MSRISIALPGALGAVATLMAMALLTPRAAWAYRPFEQTDADVADLHCIELELGPVALRRSTAELVLIAPSLVVNYGIAPGIELVVEGQVERLLRPPQERAWTLRDPALSLKGLVRRGALQGDSGLSVAVEPGVLLPSAEEGAMGAEVGIILSTRGSAGTVHLNVVPGFSRAHAAGASVGVIVEGPYDWWVRPVGEVIALGEVGEDVPSFGVLTGFIARASANVSFDTAFRFERANHVTTSEVRAGLTWTFGHES